MFRKIMIFAGTLLTLGYIIEGILIVFTKYIPSRSIIAGYPILLALIFGTITLEWILKIGNRK
jgi:hypothetical protein